MDEMDGRGRLISSAHTGGMEGDFEPNASVQLFRQKHRHLQRSFQFLAAVHLLLIAAVLALAAVVVLGDRSSGCKPVIQPDSHPPAGFVEKQQQRTDLESPSAMLSDVKEEDQHCTSGANPSAMVTAPRGNITIGTYLDWESKEGNAHCCGGVKYSSGHLVVPRRGMYRVFLQITFESRATPCGPVRELKLINTMYLFQVNYPKYVPILSSADTVTCNQESWKKSLFTSGLFKMDANSKLAVTSSSPNRISNWEEETFFGVEFVSE